MIFNNRMWFSWNQQSSVHLLYLTLQAAREDLAKFCGFSWPLTILFYEGDQVYWLNRWEELRALGLKMLDCLLVPGYQETFYEEEFPMKSKEVETSVEALRRTDLTQLSNEHLLDCYAEFIRVYKGWYALGWYAEPVQFCAEQLVDEELKRLRDIGIISDRLITETRLYLYSSAELTYASEIEDSLLACTQTLFSKLERAGLHVALNQAAEGKAEFEISGPSKGNGHIVLGGTFYADVLENNADFADAKLRIQEHAEKYYWKRNNYFSTEVVTPQMVLLECLTLGTRYSLVELTDKIGATARRLAANQELRNESYQRLGSYFRSVVDVLARNSKMKDTRKMIISLANHAIDLILNEIANRSGYKLEDVHCLLPEELSESLSNTTSLREEIDGRHKTTVIFWGEQDTAPPQFSFNTALRRDEHSSARLPPSSWTMPNCLIASDDTARQLIKSLNDKFRFILDWEQGNQLYSISGECAYARDGQDEVRGVVRIVKDPKNAPDFKEGDILVAPSTTPDYVPLIRQASCIVTDFGGWTSHAALCAREFNISCIIGTHYASQVLVSGEEVTVRVREGVVLRRNSRRSKK